MSRVRLTRSNTGCTQGGAPVISTELYGDNMLRWQPNGQAVTYRALARDGQVWRQPLDGGPPEQLTQFDHGRTLVERLTSAGHILADRKIVTDDVEAIRDAVLIRNF